MRGSTMGEEEGKEGPNNWTNGLDIWMGIGGRGDDDGLWGVDEGTLN